MTISFTDYVPERGEAPAAHLDVAPKSGADQETDDGFSFWDLLDVVNPLQHIPVISSIYRHFTGDDIDGPARLAGGFLYGGPIGFAASAANLGMEMATGNDLGGHIMEALDGPEPGEAGPMDADFAHASAAYGHAGEDGGALGGTLDVFDIEAPG
jgi:hypothetical protein